MRGALTALLLLVGLAGCSDEPPPSHPPCGQPLEICPLIGSGAQDFNGDGLAPEETALNLPSVARVTPDGGVCVMDFNNYRLRCLRDGVMETIAGSGVHAYATVDVDALSSPLENPIDFGYLPDGRVVFVSLHDPRVLRIEEDGLLVAIAGTGEVGDSGDGGPATEALFDELAGLVVGQDGTIYVSDDQAHRIRKITPDGIVDTVAGTGEKGAAGDGGPAREAQLYHPMGLALDAADNLYVADAYNHRIRRVDAQTGVIDTIAGRGEQDEDGDGGPAVDAAFAWPNGVAIGDDGRVYVADTFNHRIRRIGLDGIVETIAGSTKGYSGDDGPALDAQLRGPAYLEVTEDRLIVADQQNQVVRVLYLK